MGSWTGAREEVAGLAAALDPSRLSVADAVALLPVVTEIKNIAAATEASLAARIAESDRHQAEGSRSPAEDYARRTGMPIGQAKDALAVGAAMRESERLRQAAMQGQLSPAQGGVIGDLASDLPDAVDDLLDLLDAPG